MSGRRLVWTPLVWLMLHAAPAAQMPLPNVVQVQSPDDSGAGFIVGTRGSEAYVVTARHVVFPSKNVHLGDTGWQSCGEGTRVALYPRRIADWSAHDVRCNRDPSLDIAVFPITLPADVLAGLRRYPLGTPAATSVNFFVTVIGHPSGHPWAVASNNSVTRYDPAVDTKTFTFTKRNIEQGFSGGPVIADGLVGMVTSTEGSDAMALQWSRIASELDAADIPTNLLTGADPSAVTFQPSLAATLDDDAARNAIRRYAYALNHRRRAEILNVYPSLNAGELDALLGDTSAIDLGLTNCRRRSSPRPEAVVDQITYSCSYRLILTRRTGMSGAPPGAVPGMSFVLGRAQNGWIIHRIEQE